MGKIICPKFSIVPYLIREAIERLYQTGNSKPLKIHLGDASPLRTMRYLSILRRGCT